MCRDFCSARLRRMLYFRQMRLLLLTCLILAAAGSALAQCPTLAVVGPAEVTNPGDEMTFRAVIDSTTSKVRYSWTVSGGTIVKGQGTAEVTVATTRELEGSSITATVELDGISISCDRSASETAGIAQTLIGCAADEWGDLKPTDERGRLDLFFAELSNNPNNIGLLILRVKEGDKLDPGNSRIQFVLRHAKFRKFDKSRIWFALETAEEKSTQVWRIPPGAEPPCKDCLIYLGESL